ncbi:MAG: hypothetical protein OXC69_00330, partial [Candidatus Tectomicrobia bacterium]|nr:hypothetical protein [Candidatus Tectomicrobia bacterium]
RQSKAWRIYTLLPLPSQRWVDSAVFGGCRQVDGIGPVANHRALGEGHMDGVAVFAPSAGFHDSLVSA